MPVTRVELFQICHRYFPHQGERVTGVRTAVWSRSVRADRHAGMKKDPFPDPRFNQRVKASCATEPYVLLPVPAIPVISGWTTLNGDSPTPAVQGQWANVADYGDLTLELLVAPGKCLRLIRDERHPVFKLLLPVSLFTHTGFVSITIIVLTLPSDYWAWLILYFALCWKFTSEKQAAVLYPAWHHIIWKIRFYPIRNATPGLFPRKNHIYRGIWT